MTINYDDRITGDTSDLFAQKPNSNREFIFEREFDIITSKVTVNMFQNKVHMETYEPIKMKSDINFLMAFGNPVLFTYFEDQLNVKNHLRLFVEKVPTDASMGLDPKSAYPGISTVEIKIGTTKERYFTACLF